MSDTVKPPRSCTFLVRVWLEPSDKQQDAWWGQVQSASSGIRYFRDWETLIEHLRTALRRESKPSDPA
jgi:hypothetical protein